MSIYDDRQTECAHEEDGFEPFSRGLLRSIYASSRAYAGKPDRDLRHYKNMGDAFQRLDYCVRSDAEAAYEEGIVLCESPIEIWLLPWLISAGHCLSKYHHFPIIKLATDLSDDNPIGIIPQFSLIRYRLDFVVCKYFKKNAALVAVECDGADFHDPKKDAIRDAKVLAEGVPIIRASGSDIMRNPAAVARRVMANLLNQTGTPVG